jgi:hypothetical protein
VNGLMSRAGPDKNRRGCLTPPVGPPEHRNLNTGDAEAGGLPLRYSPGELRPEYRIPPYKLKNFVNFFGAT